MRTRPRSVTTRMFSVKHAANCPNGVPAPVKVGELGMNRNRVSIS